MTPHQALAANGKSFDWARRFIGEQMGGDAAIYIGFAGCFTAERGDITDGPRRLVTICMIWWTGASPPIRFG